MPPGSAHLALRRATSRIRLPFRQMTVARFLTPAPIFDSSVRDCAGVSCKRVIVYPTVFCREVAGDSGISRIARKQDVFRIFSVHRFGRTKRVRMLREQGIR